jgi:hypothetical protein
MVVVGLVEKCEESEVSELSPEPDLISGETGRFFGLLITSRRHAASLSSWPGIASGSPVMWCFPSCQNCSIKRTPGRTLLAR